MSNFNVSREFREELFKLAYDTNRRTDVDVMVVSRNAERLLTAIGLYDVNSGNRYKQQVLNKFMSGGK